MAAHNFKVSNFFPKQKSGPFDIWPKKRPMTPKDVPVQNSATKNSQHLQVASRGKFKSFAI